MRRLPTWFYVFMAVAIYLGLHQLSKMLVSMEGLAQIGAKAAYWGQYLLPFLLLLTAVFLGRGDVDKRKARRPEIIEPSGSKRSGDNVSVIKIDPFRRMSRDDFHRLLSEFFVRNGFKVEPSPPGLGDGVDLMLSKNGKSFVAQYRHWRELRVGVPMVREQYTVMQAAKADGVYVVTTGEFTYKAIQYAEDKNISLIDGLKLRRLVRRPPAGKEVENIDQPPFCPLCAAEMKIRTSSDEQGNEKRFWSCSNYPKCSGTVDMMKRSGQ